MTDQVVVLSTRDVKRMNAASEGRKVPATVVDNLDQGGFHVVGTTLLLDDGATMRMVVLLKMQDTMTPLEAVIDCPLDDYFTFNRVEVSVLDEPEEGE